MEKQKSIKINFLMNMILTLSSFIFPVITYPYIARVLLPVGTGKVRLATAFVSYFTLFAQLGIPTYGIRVCAKVRDNKEELTRTAQELLMINLIMNVISYLALFLMIRYIPRLYEEKTLYMIISATIFLSSIGMEWLYRAMEMYTYITIRSVIFKLIALILMFLLVHEQADYITYGAISIFAASASNILNFVNAHKYIGFKPVGHYNLNRHIKPVLVFFSMACASTIYTNLDAVMLGFMRSETDVGYYDAAVKVKTILVSIVTSLGTVLLPRASYYIQNNLVDLFWKICNKALRFVCLLAVPMAVYFIMFAREGVLFLSGPEFEDAVVPMMIIMPTIVFIGLTNVLGIQMLVPLGKEKMVLISEVVGAFVDLVINAALIPTYGAAGAAFGTLIAEIAVFLVQFSVLRNDAEQMFRKIKWNLILAGVILGAAVSFWILFIPMSLFFTLALSAILFFGAYGIVMLLGKEDLVMEIVNGIKEKLIRTLGKR